MTYSCCSKTERFRSLCSQNAEHHAGSLRGQSIPEAISLSVDEEGHEGLEGYTILSYARHDEVWGPRYTLAARVWVPSRVSLDRYLRSSRRGTFSCVPMQRKGLGFLHGQWQWLTKRSIECAHRCDRKQGCTSPPGFICVSTISNFYQVQEPD